MKLLKRSIVLLAMWLALVLLRLSLCVAQAARRVQR
jgi:hypothetical protein